MHHDTVERGTQRVVIFTGAGVSAESGVPTFRGAGGLWREFRAEELATPEAFARDPRLVWEWYAWRRELVARCAPNAAHRAIAEYVARHPTTVLVTQNVDGLHQRAAREAGTDPDDVVALHGRLFGTRCVHCARRDDAAAIDYASHDTLPRCSACGGLLRPDVVWFGESLDESVLARAFDAAARATRCIVVGTSGVVHPAATVVTVAARAGAEVIEVNPDATALSHAAARVTRATACDALPALLADA